MSLLRDMAGPFVDESLLPPLAMEEIRSRARKRRLKRRLSYACSPVLAGLLILGVLAAVSNSNTSPDMRFTSFATPGPPHLLDNEISFSFLPSGFHLVSDERINKGTLPVNYLRTIVYQGGTSAGPEQVVLGIQQSASEAIPSRLPSSNSSESSSFTSIRGHKAVVANFYDHVYGHVSYTYFQGKREETITCSGPANAPASQIDPVCQGLSTTGSQSGPPPSSAPILANTYPRISLVWIERPGVMFTLSGSGMTLSTLKEVAAGINYNPSIGNCIVDGKPLYSGPCAPGVVGSPPVNSPLVPTGGTELASGTVAGRAWALSAHMQSGNTWVDLGFSGQSRGSWFSSSSASPAISVQTRNDGQRFLFGIMPSTVTSFAVKSQGHSTIRSKVLPAKLDGWSFFIMPLGKVTGICNAVCTSPLHLTFYSGSKIVYSSNWSQDATASGLQIP